MYCAQRAPVITIIRYAHSTKMGEPNDLEVIWSK